MIRDCPIIAVEGTQSSGKSTLVHALVSAYRERGIHAGYVDEPARHSPLVEEVLTGMRPRFDIACEVDLFTAQISDQIRAARNHQLLIADKTIVNVLAYCRNIFTDGITAEDGQTLEAMEKFARTWCSYYDVVLLCSDLFPERLESESYRAPIFSYQSSVARHLEELLVELSVRVTSIPVGLTTAERVCFAMEAVKSMNLPMSPVGDL